MDDVNSRVSQYLNASESDLTYRLFVPNEDQLPAGEFGVEDSPAKGLSPDFEQKHESWELLDNDNGVPLSGDGSSGHFCRRIVTADGLYSQSRIQQDNNLQPPMNFVAGAWSPREDQLLSEAHELGLTLTEIRDQYFQSRTPESCVVRHQYLQKMKQKGTDGWSAPKTRTLVKEYMSMREEIWSGLAARVGEEWSVVEEKCMLEYPKSFQSTTHATESHASIIKGYVSMREEVWSGLAARIQEDWGVVEEKCMSTGLDGLQRMAIIQEKHAKLSQLKPQRGQRLRTTMKPSIDRLVSTLQVKPADELPVYSAKKKIQNGDQASIPTANELTPNPADGRKFEESIRGPGTSIQSPTTGIRRFYLLSWIRKLSRPKIQPGYRRIEWTCDCGVDLYGDFAADKTSDLDDLESSLHTPVEGTSTNNSSDSEQSVETLTNTRRHLNSRSSSSSKTALSTGSTDASSIDIIQPKFLALCINSGGIYKTLAELDTTHINSDGEAFSQMKKAYLQYRGVRSRLRFLIKPATVEFVRFTLWNLRHGYVSVCDRPNSMPPNTRIDYDFILPPMPPEVFVHYLEHGDGDLSPNRYTWLPRLPKRLNNKVIDRGEATEGWGIHIIEGPNREAVFWILIVTISASVVASVLWTTLKGDIQGGTGLGALIVALPPAIIAAFLFRLGAT